jgi:hypothetical protein
MTSTEPAKEIKLRPGHWPRCDRRAKEGSNTEKRGSGSVKKKQNGKKVNKKIRKKERKSRKIH